MHIPCISAEMSRNEQGVTCADNIIACAPTGKRSEGNTLFHAFRRTIFTRRFTRDSRGIHESVHKAPEFRYTRQILIE